MPVMRLCALGLFLATAFTLPALVSVRAAKPW
jgi:hypothetical protein